MADRAQRVQTLYDDPARQREIEALGNDPFGTFYQRLQQVRDHHRNIPTEIVLPTSIRLPDEFQPPEENKAKAKPKPAAKPNRLFQMPEDQNQGAELEDDKNKEDANPLPDYVDFTDEERTGRYLDLHAIHEAYLNLKSAPRVEYIDYVTQFQDFSKIPREHKLNAAYQRYLQDLLNYLCDFYGRIRPLENLNKRLAETRQEFEQHWQQGTAPGWEYYLQQQQQQQVAAEPLDLAPFKSAKDLESVGLDRLKGALMALGLKCGGSLTQRAERLFSTKGKALNQIDKSLFADKKKSSNSSLDTARAVAELEYQVAYIADQMKDIQAATKDNVERKLARAGAEDEEDDEEAVKLIDIKAAAPEEPIVKRKNLVLDWEGKPIPYWLFRLHGLNQTYNCEICGDFIYRGPKAYTEHFTEWRHAQGMRQLGIPNTMHFMNITKIADAQALWAKLQSEKDKDRFKADQEEEYEDSLGNVVSKKTYEDLKRQGLL